MISACKNCNNPAEGKYCSCCGQATHTKRISIHLLWHDIQHGLFHFDNGIFYTIKQLFTRPGKSIREYLEGKRISHFKPISLIIVLATVYGFLTHYFHIDTVQIIAEEETPHDTTVYNKLSNWIESHFALTTLIRLPLYSLASFILFRKQGFNFMEHVVLNAFATGQRLIIHLLTFPIFYWCIGAADANITRWGFSLIDFAFLLWTYCQFFRELKPLKAFLLTILSYALAFVFFVMLSTLTGALIGLFLKQ